ncbi:aminoglycoside phosphotransferase family protein [archaeon]|nr:aminoglycoside phosphotransferase family protein [archaeon]
MGYDLAKRYAKELSFLGEGNGNFNFLVQEGEKKCVLRFKKSKEKQFMDSLEREHVFLKYFKSKGIDFCPKALYYDKARNFLVQSFIEGKKLGQRDFSHKVIDLFAKKIWEIFSLSVSDFHKFCKKNGVKKYERDDPIESLKKFGFKRFEGLSEEAVDSETRAWIKKKLDENLEFLKGEEHDDKEGGFSAGVIQNDVFIEADGKMSFYDFEFVNIYDGPPLVWIKIHGDFSEEQFDYLLDRYSHYSGVSKEKLLEGIRAREKIIRVNDVIWAAMKLDEQGNCDFMKLMRKRIGLVEKLKNK